MTDGQFYRASSSGLELEKIYGDISSMEKTSQETRLITHYEDFYQYFVGIGLLLILIETFLTDRRKVKQEWQGRFQ
jgi:Ca-activated chloride channel family protein